MITLQQKRIEARQHTFYVRCGAANVGQNAYAQRAIAEYKLCRFAGVVGNGKGKHFDVADGEWTVAVNFAYEIGLQKPIGLAGKGAVGKPNGYTMFARKFADAANMIAVFVGDDDRGNISGSQTEPTQAQFRFRQAKSAVEHQPSFSGFDDQRITLATATERGEAQHGLFQLVVKEFENFSAHRGFFRTAGFILNTHCSGFAGVTY